MCGRTSLDRPWCAQICNSLPSAVVGGYPAALSSRQDLFYLLSILSLMPHRYLDIRIATCVFAGTHVDLSALYLNGMQDYPRVESTPTVAVFPFISITSGRVHINNTALRPDAV